MTLFGSFIKNSHKPHPNINYRNQKTTLINNVSLVPKGTPCHQDAISTIEFELIILKYMYFFSSFIYIFCFVLGLFCNNSSEVGFVGLCNKPL
jgi:hypothetical protein